MSCAETSPNKRARRLPMGRTGRLSTQPQSWNGAASNRSIPCHASPLALKPWRQPASTATRTCFTPQTCRLVRDIRPDIAVGRRLLPHKLTDTARTASTAGSSFALPSPNREARQERMPAHRSTASHYVAGHNRRGQITLPGRRVNAIRSILRFQ